MSEPARNEEIEIIENFDEETNNFLHWTQNRDKIYFYRKELKSKEQSFFDKALYRKAKNDKDDLMAKEPGCASLTEGICLKENLPSIYITENGIFALSHEFDNFNFFVNCDPEFIKFIRNDNEFNDYIDNSDKFFYWIQKKKQDFDYIEDRKKSLQILLDNSNKKQEVALELSQILIDLNFQTLKELLLELEKVYPYLFKRWIFNWRKFRFERNPLCYPSLENLNDISDKLHIVDNKTTSKIFYAINNIAKYKNNVNNSNLNFQEINDYILKPIVIYKDNEVIFHNIKANGTIESFSFFGKSARLFEKHKEIILPYLEKAIKERNFVPFWISLQLKLESIRWWQNGKQEIEDFFSFSSPYVFLRDYFIKKYKFSIPYSADFYYLKKSSNFFVALDKNIDKSFCKIKIYLQQLKKIHPEFFVNPLSILNVDLNLSNINDFDDCFFEIYKFINDKESSRLFKEILIYINFIKNSVHYLKKSLRNNLDDTDLKNSFKSILPAQDFNIFIETIDEICIKFNINESKIYCSQFFVIYTSISEIHRSDFISYLKVLNCIRFNDIEDVKIKDSTIEIRDFILKLVESASPEKFEICFDDFSAKTKTLYNDYFEVKYEEISKKISNYENQINDSKNFIQQYKDALKKFLNMDDKNIDAINLQISNSEIHFNELSNKINKKSKILNDLDNTQNQYQTTSNEIQNISNEIKNSKEQLRNKHSDIEKNANELSKKVDELNCSLQETEEALKFNNNQIETEKQNIEAAKIFVNKLDEKAANITKDYNQCNTCLKKQQIKNKVFNYLKPTANLFHINKVNKKVEQNERYEENLSENSNDLGEQIALNEEAKKQTQLRLKDSVSKILAFKDEGKHLLHKKNEIEKQLAIFNSQFNDYKNFMNTREYSLLCNFVNGNSNDNNYNDKPLLNNETLLDNELNH